MDTSATYTPIKSDDTKLSRLHLAMNISLGAGLYFALRGGAEQEFVFRSNRTTGQAPHLKCYEDDSKNNLEICHRKLHIHYANPNPGRRFVCLYKLYCSKCPSNTPENAFISLHSL